MMIKTSNILSFDIRCPCCNRKLMVLNISKTSNVKVMLLNNKPSGVHIGENATQIVKYKYTYDANGNIKNIYENNLSKYVYTYDSLNQLTRVADASQYYLFDYTYDNAGNITEKKAIKSNPGGGNLGTTIINYSYSDSTWGDLLTGYDNDTITYDEIGNPTSYRDGMTMSWSGRELQSITKGNDSYSFTYNLNGLRTKKNVNGTNTFYYYDDSNNLIGLKKGNTTVLFYYDSEGSLYSMSKGEDTYFFIKDLQGDVRKIIDENGTVCATYFYDAWGALLAEDEDSSVEGLNPFRYRGYVYDAETELYYLQSRYYDPKTGRFINADDPEYTDTFSDTPLSTNMFAYCENNAVNGYDPSGNWVTNEDKIKGHPTLTKKFSKTVRDWVVYADAWFDSDDYVSSPFHSRSKVTKGEGDNKRIVVEDGLKCAKYMYNLAIRLKRQFRDGRESLVQFKYSETKDSYESDVVHLKKRYMGFLKKVNKKPTKTVLTDKESKKALSLISELNSKKRFKDRNEQSEAMLGLALHTLQDYYAHRIRVRAYHYKKENVFIKAYVDISITELNNKLKWEKNSLEDSPDVYNWRWEYAKKITQVVYNNYFCNNGMGRKIKKIWAHRSNFYEGYSKIYKNGNKKNKEYILLFYMHTLIKVNWESI